MKRLTYLSGMYVGKAHHEGSNLRGEAPLSDRAKAKAEGSITLSDALAIYCRIVEPSARVTIVPIPVMRLTNRLFMNGELGPTLDLMKAMQHLGDVGDAAPAREILGAPSTTLRVWCEARARARAIV